jgi:hypothetical protein
MRLPIIVIRSMLVHVKAITSCNPIIISDITSSVIGSQRAYFLLRYAPENKAIAIIGVKFGTWGISLVKIPIKIKDIIIIMVLR